MVLALVGDATAEVERFEAEHPGAFKAVLTLAPEAGQSDGSIECAGDAVALAIQAKEQMRRVRNRERARAIHLIPYTPAAFCLFLGQRLNALGPIVLYERTASGGYAPWIELQTG